MTARVLLPDAADDVLDGDRTYRRDRHAVRDGFAHPDRFLHSLLDLLALDGVHVEATARLRGWCRAAQKDAEGRP